MTKVASSVSETKYTQFDEMGRLRSHEQYTDGRTFSTAYTYNLSGALIEETYPSTRKVKNTLNADGELSMVQSQKNSNYGYYAYAMGLSYTAAGGLEKMRLGNGHWENYEYNNRLQVTKIGLGTLDDTQDLLKLEYAYGMWESGTLNTAKNNGSLAQQIITVPNSPGASDAFTATQKYTYDSLNRLESATETVPGSQTWKQTFSYDRYGNRRFDANNTTTIPTGCSAAVCNPDISTSTNRLSSTGYSYDAEGNLTQDAAGKRFGYDQENRQKEFFVASNGSSNPDATYYYDGEGKRVKKINSTETVIFVYNGGGKLVAEYSTQLAATQQVSYLTADHLGSARVITNEIGQVKKRQDYAAFGDEIVTSQRTARTDYTTNDELREGYTGYEKDDESGLDYAQARYYNSSHGRFTSIDPLTASATIRDPQSFNRYSYVLNSPYKFTDPLGLLPLSSMGAGSGNAARNGSYGGVAEFDYVQGNASFDNLKTINEAIAEGLDWLASRPSDSSWTMPSSIEATQVDQQSTSTISQSASVSYNPLDFMCMGNIPTTVTVTRGFNGVDQGFPDGSMLNYVSGRSFIFVSVFDQFGQPIIGILTEKVTDMSGKPIIYMKGLEP
jgi:RHS repeat-associated protein